MIYEEVCGVKRREGEERGKSEEERRRGEKFGGMENK